MKIWKKFVQFKELFLTCELWVLDEVNIQIFHKDFEIFENWESDFIFTNSFTVTILTSSSNSNAKETPTTLDLISCGYHEIPCTFKISANNSTYSFNAHILKAISPTIRARLQSNPGLNEFRIGVSDSTNVMQKFEDLLKLFPIEISQTELSILQHVFVFWLVCVFGFRRVGKRVRVSLL